MEREDIPPIDVLEAAARRDREETEELLAGFDRPGRGPRRARKRDFVSYYAGDKTSPPSPQPSPQGETPRAEPRRAPTFVLPKRPRVPAWLPWAGLASMMIAFGGLVAFLATAEPTPAATGTTPVATSKTTITSAPKPTITPRADDIPPPAVTSGAAEPVPAPAPTSPSSTSSPRPRESAPGSSGPPPREDFIRRF